MPRVKRGTKRHNRRKKLLELAKGYYLYKSKLYKFAKEAVENAHRSLARREQRQARVPVLAHKSRRASTVVDKEPHPAALVVDRAQAEIGYWKFVIHILC